MDDASPLDRLRRRYQQLIGAPPQTFDMPIARTADGDLVAVYREPDPEEVDEIADRWSREGVNRTDERLYGYAELLAKACVDILLRDDENGEERPGLPGKYLPGLGLGGGPVNFHSAATALGVPVSDEDPLVAVFNVLGGSQGGGWEVDRHGHAVSTWEPRVASPEVEDEFAGESGADQPSAESPAGT